MFRRMERLYFIGLIVALAGCSARVDQPLPANTSYSNSVASPDNWFHTWWFYVKNDLNVPVRQFARDAHCMESLPAEKDYASGYKVAESVETSHDPKCYLKESSVTFDYFAKLGGGYGTVKWKKPFFFNYSLETVATHGLCFTIHNLERRILVIHHC
jgi:hypothetical protein